MAARFCQNGPNIGQAEGNGARGTRYHSPHWATGVAPTQAQSQIRIGVKRVRGGVRDQSNVMRSIGDALKGLLDTGTRPRNTKQRVAWAHARKIGDAQPGQPSGLPVRYTRVRQATFQVTGVPHLAKRITGEGRTARMGRRVSTSWRARQGRKGRLGRLG